MPDPSRTRWLTHLRERGAIRVVGDRPAAIDRMTTPAAAVAGHPVYVMRAGLAKDPSQADNVPAWVNRFRAWMPVDPEQAAQVLASPDVPDMAFARPAARPTRAASQTSGYRPCIRSDAPYDALQRERARRVTRIRSELERLEAAHGGSR